MYWLFRVKGWAPGDYARMSPGERDLVWALASYEAEHGPPPGCPFLLSLIHIYPGALAFYHDKLMV